MKYRERQRTVDAVQNDGRWETILAWLDELAGGKPARFPPVQRVPGGGGHGLVRVRGRHGWEEAIVGDWIVRAEGDYEVIAGPAFTRHFEPGVAHADVLRAIVEYATTDTEPEVGHLAALALKGLEAGE